MMERRLEKVAFVLEELRIDTPGQQLLDRFLIGYPRDGEFHRVHCNIHIWLPDGDANQEIQRRAADFELVVDRTLEDAVAGADGIVLVPRGASAGPLLSAIILAAGPGSSIFAYGAIAESIDQARTLVSHAMARKVLLLSGTSTSVTWRLPDIDLPQGATVTEALIVVQGEFPLAELHAIDGLLALLERRAGGERGIKNVRLSEGQDVWKLLEDRPIARRLLAAALSRSDSPQGLSVRDGRTQNLMAPGLIQTLAESPRAWSVDHADNLRTAVVVLDGVVADYNFAACLSDDGAVLSAQLYRPPAPERHEYSRLAQVIEDYSRTGRLPWPVERSIVTCEFLNACARLRQKERVP